MSPTPSHPEPMAKAAPTPMSKPTTVRWSGVRPVRRRALPRGFTALSIGVLNLPSNTTTKFSTTGAHRRASDCGPWQAGPIRERSEVAPVGTKTTPDDLAVTFTVAGPTPAGGDRRRRAGRRRRRGRRTATTPSPPAPACWGWHRTPPRWPMRSSASRPDRGICGTRRRSTTLRRHGLAAGDVLADRRGHRCRPPNNDLRPSVPCQAMSGAARGRTNTRPQKLGWGGSSTSLTARTTASVGGVGDGERRGPAPGVVLDKVLDDRAVDGVDEHEAAALGLPPSSRAPGNRLAAQPPPHLLGRGVADGEPDRPLGRTRATSRRRACASRT